MWLYFTTGVHSLSKLEHLGMQCLTNLSFYWRSQLIGNKHQQQFLNELY